jgi:hypothetical protein
MPVIVPEPSSPEPVSNVMSEEVLILETEFDAVSDVESVGSVVRGELFELDTSEELVSVKASVLLDASLPIDSSDELSMFVEPETPTEVAVAASRLWLDEELLLS